MNPKSKTKKELLSELEGLRARLEEAEETLRAIHSGEVDALMISSPQGEQVFTLKGAEYTYRMLIERMHEGALTLSPDGTILYGNSRLAEMLGIPLETVIGSSLQEFVSKQDQRAFEAILENSRKDGGQGEISLRRRSGAHLRVLVSGRTMQIETGEVFCLVLADLSERKRTEKIIASERLARSILEQAGEMIVVCDEKGEIIQASEVAHQFAGRSLLSQPFSRIFHLELASNGRTGTPFTLSPILSGEVLRNVGVTLEKSGSIFHFLLSARPLVGGKGDIFGCVVILTDITERQRAEEELLESRKKLQCLFDSDIIGILYADLDKITEANDAFLHMIGYTRKDLGPAGIPWKEITPPEFTHLDEQGLQEMETTGSCTPFEKEYIRKDGSRVPILIGAALLERSPLRWACFVLDMSERKRMDEFLRRAHEQLEIKVEERTRDLIKRLMELNCLYMVSSFLNKEEHPLDEALQHTLQIVPSGWQFPEITRARMVVRGREFKTERFEEGPWKQNSRIYSRGKQIGILEVHYLEEKQQKDEGPFLKEERSLIDALADQVGEFIERKEAQESLRESNELLEGVFSSIDLHVAYMDRNFAFIRVNRAYAESDGKTPEFYPGKNHFDLYPHKENEAIFRKVVETGKPCIVLEKPFLYPERPDRGPTYWDWSLYPVKDPEGKVGGVVLSLVNVTARKKALEALWHTEEMLHKVLNTLPVGVWVADKNGEILMANPAAQQIWGGAKYVRLHETDAYKAWWPDSGKRIEAGEWALARAIRDGATTLNEMVQIESFDGRKKTIVNSAVPLRGPDQEIIGGILVNEEITQRVNTEQDRLRLATAVEQASEGISILDAERAFLYVNPAFEQLRGLSRQEVLGKRYEEVLREEERDELSKGLLEETLKRGEVWDGRLTRKKPDGSTCELEVRISPVRDASSALIHFVAVERDVTQEVKIQERIRQWQKMEALGTLAGGVAHDFNNILMPIMINTDLALLDIREGIPPSERHLQLVREAAVRGQELVKQIITFSRQKEQPRIPIKVSPLVKETLKFLKSTVPKNVKIRANIGVETGMVLADPTQIHQVLMNLCNNAAQAMRDQGGIVEVSLDGLNVDLEMAAQLPGLRPGPYLRLTVRDNGQGMDSTVMEKAFDPFFTTKAPGEGTGMGLAVVHGIVKNYGGTITLESQVGKGTKITVFLPQKDERAETEAAAQGPVPRGKERILLVDDDEIQVRSVQNMLERLGYSVIGETDARKALRIFQAQPNSFDLVITDQTMPIRGDILAREFLSVRADIPIILCTGFSETINREEARDLGVRDFAMKPLTVRDLAEKIRRVLK
jgi:PAS domain S-box-containing protein